MKQSSVDGKVETGAMVRVRVVVIVIVIVIGEAREEEEETGREDDVNGGREPSPVIKPTGANITFGRRTCTDLMEGVEYLKVCFGVLVGVEEREG